MEVHNTHAGHPGHKKSWKSYLLEFFMLFLAVFLGFTAENIREHQVEKHRGMDYVRSLLQDLRQDSSGFESTIKANTKVLGNIDTSIKLLNAPVIDDSASRFLYCSHKTNPYFSTLIFNQRTISQLRSSGAFRLVSNQAVSDSTMFYYDRIDFAAWMREELLSALKDDRGTGFQIFNDYLTNDYSPFTILGILKLDKKFPLMTYDRNILIPYANKLRMRYDWLNAYNMLLKSLQGRCSRLIDLIKKEYHF